MSQIWHRLKIHSVVFMQVLGPTHSQTAALPLQLSSTAVAGVATDEDPLRSHVVPIIDDVDSGHASERTRGLPAQHAAGSPEHLRSVPVQLPTADGEGSRDGVSKIASPAAAAHVQTHATHEQQSSVAVGESTESTYATSVASCERLDCSIAQRIVAPNVQPCMLSSIPGTPAGTTTPTAQASKDPSSARSPRDTASANAAAWYANVYPRGTSTSAHGGSPVMSSIESKPTSSRVQQTDEAAWHTHNTLASTGRVHSAAFSDLTSIGAMSPGGGYGGARLEQLCAPQPHQNPHSNRSSSSMSTAQTNPSQTKGMRQSGELTDDTLETGHNRISAALQKFQMTHMGFPFLRETPREGHESGAEGSNANAMSGEWASWSVQDTLRSPAQSSARATNLNSDHAARAPPQEAMHSPRPGGAVNAIQQQQQQQKVTNAKQVSQIAAAAPSAGDSAASFASAAAVAAAQRADTASMKQSGLPSAPRKSRATSTLTKTASEFVSDNPNVTDCKSDSRLNQDKRPRQHRSAAAACTSEKIVRHSSELYLTPERENSQKSSTAGLQRTRKRPSQPVAEAYDASELHNASDLDATCIESAHVVTRGLPPTKARRAYRECMPAGAVGEAREPRESFASHASSVSHDGNSALRPLTAPSSMADSMLRPDSAHHPLDAALPLATVPSFASSDRSPHQGYLMQGLNTEPHSGMLESYSAPMHAPHNNTRPTRDTRGHITSSSRAMRSFSSAPRAGGGLHASPAGPLSAEGLAVMNDLDSSMQDPDQPQSLTHTPSHAGNPTGTPPGHTPTYHSRTQSSHFSESLSQLSQRQHDQHSQRTQQELQVHRSAPSAQIVTTPAAPPNHATPLSSTAQHAAAIALLTDAARTVWLAFILPVFNLVPHLRYSLAFASILISAVVTVVSTRTPRLRAPYQAGLLTEGVSVVVAAGWLLKASPGNSEPWCNTAACMAPVILLWTIMLALYGAYLAYTVFHAVTVKPLLLTSSAKRALLTTTAQVSGSDDDDDDDVEASKTSHRSPRSLDHKAPVTANTASQSRSGSSRLNNSDACLPMSHSHRGGYSASGVTTGTALTGGGGSDALVSGYQVSQPAGSFRVSSMHGTEQFFPQDRVSVDNFPQEHPQGADAARTAQAEHIMPIDVASNQGEYASDHNDQEPDAPRTLSGEEKQTTSLMAGSRGVSASLRFNPALQQQAAATGGGDVGADAPPVYMPPSSRDSTEGSHAEPSVAKPGSSLVGRESKPSRANTSMQGSTLGSNTSTVGPLMLPVAPVGEQAASRTFHSVHGSADLDGLPSASAHASGIISEASAQISVSGMAPAGQGGSGMTSFGSTAKHAKHAAAAGFTASRVPSESISLLGLTVRFTDSSLCSL